MDILWGDGHGSFGKPVMLPVDGGPFMAAVADFNGDGKLDIAVGGGANSPSDTNNLSVLLGRRQGEATKTNDVSVPLNTCGP